MPAYETVTEALTSLKSRGYTIDFNLAFDKILCGDTNICLTPSEFEITEFHRFEGALNPSDEEIVYAIESKDGSIKGTLVSAFGTYSEPMDDELLGKLQIHR